MARARRESSDPKGYFFRWLWDRSRWTWCRHAMPCRAGRPQLPTRGAAADPTAILKTSLVSHG